MFVFLVVQNKHICMDCSKVVIMNLNGEESALRNVDILVCMVWKKKCRANTKSAFVTRFFTSLHCHTSRVE